MTDRPKKLGALWRRFSQCNSRKLPPLDAPPPVPSSPIAAAANTTVIMIDGRQPKNRRQTCASASESPPSDPELLSLDDAEIAAVQDAVSNDADAAHPVGDLPVRVEAQGSAPSSDPDRGDHRQRTLDPILRKTTPDYGSFFDGRVHAADRRSYRSNLRIKTESDCLYDEMTEAAVHRSGHQLHFADDDSLCDAIVLRMERERRRRRAHSTHFEMRTPEDHLLKSGSSDAESTSRPHHRQTLQREGLSRSMPKLVQSMRITRQQAERRLPVCAPRSAQSWLHIPQLPASSGSNGFVHAMNNFPPGQHHSSRHPLQGPARNVFAYTTMQPVRQTAHKYPQMPDWQQQSQYGYHLQQHPQLSQSTRRVRRQESVCTSENLADYSSQRERQLQEVYQEAPDDPGFFQQFHQPMSVQQTPVFVIPNVAAPTMKLVSQAQWPAGFGAVSEPTSTEPPDAAGPPRRKSVAGRNCMLGWMLAVTAIIILALAIALFVQVSRDAQELNQLRAAVAEDYQFEQTHHSGGQGLIKPTKPS